MRVFPLLRKLRAPLSRRREHRREPTAIAVDWHLFGSAVHHVSTTKDLSSRGAMLESVSRMPVGTPLVLALHTATGPVEVHARVAWSAEAGMGLRFTRPVTLEHRTG